MVLFFDSKIRASIAGALLIWEMKVREWQKHLVLEFTIQTDGEKRQKHMRKVSTMCVNVARIEALRVQGNQLTL